MTKILINLARCAEFCYLSKERPVHPNSLQQFTKGKNMNKSDLLEKVARSCDISKTTADQVLTSIIGTITNAVAAGEKVTLIDLGTFSVAERAAREGRNPKTGETIAIAARKVAKFKAGKKFADAVK
jgi:DNA-binding protein HU-beta